MRLRLRPLALTRVAFLAVLGALVAPATASSAVKWFSSPSRNIECEVAAKDPRGTYVYCQTSSPLRSVSMTASGTFKVCNGVRCVGNGPMDQFRLAYGHSVIVGPFRCTSLRSGIRFIVIRTSHGFVISRAGVARV